MYLDIDTIFRDHVVKGDIHSGAHEPAKPELRYVLKTLVGAASNPSIVKGTKTALLTTTPANENYGGLVLTGDGAGYYYRSAGAWVFGRSFPETIASVTLAGPANAQIGYVEAGVNPGSILTYFAHVGTENTGAMTLTIAGDPARPVVNTAGNQLSAGEWAGGVLFFLNADNQYQLLVDAGAAASAAASATAAAQALDDALAMIVPNNSVGATKIKASESAGIKTVLGINPNDWTYL